MGESSERGTGLLLVMIDIDPEFEEDFNRWYDEEHFPERMNCPGFLSARRFVSVEGGPKYLAFYELENPEVLETPEYKAMQPPSEWSRRVEPNFKNFKRNIYRDITPELPPAGTFVSPPRAKD
ncbi:hypothetical protein BJF78_01930 [Pseudonocardia sp. CNS-139]|nr:hypothetical protein BJF78_01930 [Pseudonocardia sp. CNS-139]